MRAIVNCEHIAEIRRISRRTSFFTGVAPGELHGLRISDYRREHGVKILDVHHQWTLPRKDYPSRLAPLKTVWRRRKIPVHPSLEGPLDQWVTQGWERHVGRKPTGEDFLFPDGNGMPFRELSSEVFLQDILLVNCETTHKGYTLDLYSLRHSFATVARRSKLPGDARDRLLGHRPKDMKAMFYEDDDLPDLASEVAKIPPLLDEDTGSAGPGEASGGTEPEASNPQTLVADLVTEKMHASGASSVSTMISAEEVRFELTEPLPVRRFSKPSCPLPERVRASSPNLAEPGR